MDEKRSYAEMIHIELMEHNWYKATENGSETGQTQEDEQKKAMKEKPNKKEAEKDNTPASEAENHPTPFIGLKIY